MPITDQFQRLPLQSIIILRDDRQRRVVSTDGLLDSIRKNGVLNPIIVRRDELGNPVLIAGERRLAASSELGLADIPARWASDLSPTEARIIELEENLKREDLDWQDQVRAVAEIHRLYVGLDPGWTMSETADAISVSVAKVSQDLRINAELATNARVAASGTMTEALSVIKRVEQRTSGDALQELLEAGSEVIPAVGDGKVLPFPAPQPGTFTETELVDRTLPIPKPNPRPEADCILHKSFLEWAPSYVGPKFSFIHVDFPYGINFASGPQGKGAEPGLIYKDEAEVYWQLLECFCQHLDRFMSVSGHLMFWFSGRHEARTRQTFAKLAPSLAFTPYPLIWIKSDNAGIASDPRHGPRHVYETALFASRGKRQILKVVSDAYSAPTDKRYHISTKPEPMLRHFFQMTCDDTSSIFDPTCGSGAALRAGESLGATRILGMDTDGDCVGVARQVLRNARLLRSASA